MLLSEREIKVITEPNFNSRNFYGSDIELFLLSSKIYLWYLLYSIVFKIISFNMIIDFVRIDVENTNADDSSPK